MSKDYKVNERIRTPELRVIGETGENLGVLPTQKALETARERGMDLVVITEGANPPVAKILDFKKYLYDERKKLSAAKSKSKKSELKQFRLGPTTGEHEMEIRIKRSVEFIKEGNRVKVTVKLKGREQAYPQFGFDKLAEFAKGLEEVAKPEAPAKQTGNIIAITFVGK